MRRIESVILAFVLLAALGPAGAASAASPAVSGTIVTKDKIALTPAAVAVVTIVDQDATGTAGSIIGQQRIDGAAFPVSFSVAYDAGAVDEGRSYALFASVVDGGRTYQSVEPVPVITGGPTSGVTIQVAAVPSDAGRVAGSMVRNDRSSLSTEAVAIAALIRQDTGTMVARQVIPNPGSGDIAFAIPYDPGIIDPEATYVVRGGIVDGERRWGAVEAVEAIVSGAVAGDITVELTQVAGPAPTATPKPTATAKPTPEPTPSAEPTARPTAAPTATTTPTASPAPTRAPTPTPSPTPSPSPSPTPSPSATASPEPTPSPTPNATAVPEVGVVRGTLTYGEDHELTAEAQAIVVLVAGAGSPEAGSVVASTVMDDPGAQPVDFELLYPLDATTAGTSYYLWGGIADGDLAWVTPIGVAVKAPWPLTEGVELPLEFRPDLLKAAVSGSITGVGLVTDSPAAYATALIVHVETAEAIGFQFISPAGAAPIAFAVPYDPDDIDEDADYVVSGTVFDGTNAWHTVTGVPVITRGNAESGVVMPVVQAPPPPTPAPSVTAQPSPGPEPVPADDGGPGLVVILVVLGLVAVAGAGLVAYLRSRRTA